MNTLSSGDCEFQPLDASFNGYKARASTSTPKNLVEFQRISAWVNFLGADPCEALETELRHDPAVDEKWTFMGGKRVSKDPTLSGFVVLEGGLEP